MMSSCLDCRYAQAERAGMLIGEGWILMDADRQASNERCAACQGEGLKGEGLKGLNIAVRQWVPNGLNTGEYVGAPRTLAGPFRMGFDGAREIVVLKYRDWLASEVQRGGPVREKLRALLLQAKAKEGLVLVCVVQEIGVEIERALWELHSTERCNEGRKDSAA